MGTEIAVYVNGGNLWALPMILSLLAFFALMIAAFISGTKGIIVSLLFFILSVAGMPLAAKTYDHQTLLLNKEVTVEQLQPTANAYRHPFFLKEMVSEPGIQGELKGSIGGFLFVGGSIYGRVDSVRIITVIYKDDDSIIDSYTGVHRSISFPLENAVIETIGSAEQPYIMYPEVRTVFLNDQKVHLIPGPMHLYLPAGWKIL